MAEVYREYQQRLLAANAMDFDDLLLVAVNLLQACPDVLEHYRQRFRHVLVDEYQDTNRAQNELVLLLAGAHHQVSVVGDSDQSVYGWRGADIRNILQFEEAFPDATVVVLEQNYRSTQTILDAANAVISNNTMRKPKASVDRAGIGGEPVVRLSRRGRARRGALAGAEILRCTAPAAGDRRPAPRHPAAARRPLRVGRHRRLLPDQRPEPGGRGGAGPAGHPLQGRRAVPGSTTGREIKDLLAYLRAVANPEDEVSLKRIVNVPKRGVGDTSVARLDRFAQQHGVPFADAVARAEAAGVTGKALAGLARSADACSPTCGAERQEGGGPARLLEAVLRAHRVPGRAGGRAHRRGRRPHREHRGAGRRGPTKPTTSTTSSSR